MEEKDMFMITPKGVFALALCELFGKENISYDQVEKGWAFFDKTFKECRENAKAAGID